jgi:glyoxylase-like metal-dependent hydrolase (beta-lactamase superfamily II)
VPVSVIDTHQLGRPGIIAATALETNDGLILFDTGPESTFDNVAAGLRKIGFTPNDVRHVFLSHIHFDHAGAAWRFAENASPARTTVYVHPRGAPHLIDPSKLIKSAMRIFGDDMQKLWGRIAPVPADRVRILQDQDVVRVAPFEIRAIATPGHASHHHVYHWNDNIFGGDVAGVRLGGGPPIPPFVPPELHIESWHESIAKIRALNPAKLYLPHFGLVESSVSDHLDALDERVHDWSAWFGDKIRQGVGEQQLRSDFAKYEHNELIAGSSFADGRNRRGGSLRTNTSPARTHSLLISDYETADPSYMAVGAAIRYWNKYHPDQVTAQS